LLRVRSDEISYAYADPPVKPEDDKREVGGCQSKMSLSELPEAISDNLSNKVLIKKRALLNY
jgi:hypothetical protein